MRHNVPHTNETVLRLNRTSLALVVYFLLIGLDLLLCITDLSAGK